MILSNYPKSDVNFENTNFHEKLPSLKICFLSSVSPFGLNAWSGITYQLYHTLASDHEVFWPGPIKPSRWESRVIYIWRKWQDLLGKKYTAHFTLNAKILARNLRKMFRDEEYDCIVVGAGESEMIAYLETSLPVIYVADTTFANMVDYYPWHTGLCKSAVRQGNAIEQMAINKSFHIMYSSDWAARSAMDEYGASPQKISVVSFGASLDAVPPSLEVSRHEYTDACRLLFVGTNWIRKGGPLAVDIFNKLKSKGLKCTLTIVGCNPPLPVQEGLKVIPFLDKEKSDNVRELARLYSENDFLLLPTRADCTPVVFAEAAAYGLPVITTDTGGIFSVIHAGENGFYLPLSAGAESYADLIFQTWDNKERYESLRRQSRQAYEKRLNWKNWLVEFNRIIATLSRD